MCHHKWTKLPVTRGENGERNPRVPIYFLYRCGKCDIRGWLKFREYGATYDRDIVPIGDCADVFNPG